MMSDIAAADPGLLRTVCGHWTTGVAVVTGHDAEGRRLGMAVNSFTSVSLDPPLVLFCPALTSTTWQAIRGLGRFAVHFLAGDQADVAQSFARTGGDKFSGVPTRTVSDGLPALDGAAARLVCTTESTIPAGDHEIVVGRVQAMECDPAKDLLLFQRGRMVMR
jgi:3-hydroxy-9,10-secoandrosta-1,3,5(10)-triene-9,17-dione monooxygenase reductase component